MKNEQLIRPKPKMIIICCQPTRPAGLFRLCNQNNFFVEAAFSRMLCSVKCGGQELALDFLVSSSFNVTFAANITDRMNKHTELNSTFNRLTGGLNAVCWVTLRTVLLLSKASAFMQTDLTVRYETLSVTATSDFHRWLISSVLRFIVQMLSHQAGW